MTTHITLFRGINVGGRNRLPMKDLIRILEGLGYRNIRTYIQSGNAVFDGAMACSEEDLAKISDAVEAEFGFRPDVMLLTAQQLEDAVAGNPFPTTEGKLLHFMFLKDRPKAPDLDTLASIKTDTEQFSLKGPVFYLYTPDGFGRSKLAERAERCLGVPLTARNFNTVSAIMKML